MRHSFWTRRRRMGIRQTESGLLARIGGWYLWLIGFPSEQPSDRRRAGAEITFTGFLFFILILFLEAF